MGFTAKRPARRQQILHSYQKPIVQRHCQDAFTLKTTIF